MDLLESKKGKEMHLHGGGLYNPLGAQNKILYYPNSEGSR